MDVSVRDLLFSIYIPQLADQKILPIPKLNFDNKANKSYDTDINIGCNILAIATAIAVARLTKWIRNSPAGSQSIRGYTKITTAAK